MSNTSDPIFKNLGDCWSGSDGVFSWFSTFETGMNCKVSKASLLSSFIITGVFSELLEATDFIDGYVRKALGDPINFKGNGLSKLIHFTPINFCFVVILRGSILILVFGKEALSWNKKLLVFIWVLFYAIGLFPNVLEILSLTKFLELPNRFVDFEEVPIKLDRK